MPYIPLQPRVGERYELPRGREVAFEYQGVLVFHVYKHNSIDNGPLSYWYTLDPDGTLEFDIRQLDAWTASRGGLPHDRILQRAIETGELVPPDQPGDLR